MGSLLKSKILEAGIDVSTSVESFSAKPVWNGVDMLARLGLISEAACYLGAVDGDHERGTCVWFEVNGERCEVPLEPVTAPEEQDECREDLVTRFLDQVSEQFWEQDVRWSVVLLRQRRYWYRAVLVPNKILKRRYVAALPRRAELASFREPQLLSYHDFAELPGRDIEIDDLPRMPTASSIVAGRAVRSDAECVDAAEDYVPLLEELGVLHEALRFDSVRCEEVDDHRLLTVARGGLQLETELSETGWVDLPPLLDLLNGALIDAGVDLWLYSAKTDDQSFEVVLADAEQHALLCRYDLLNEVDPAV